MRVYQIIQYLDMAAERWPCRVAVKDGERQLTFTELRAAALNMAAALRVRLDGAAGQVIAVYIPKSLESVIANLAILYTGNAWLNLDIHNPTKRLESIDKTVNPVLYITLQNQDPPFHGMEDRLFRFDIMKKVESNIISEIISSVHKRIDTDLLCLITTSGSTGTPKAVALCHRSFVDFIAATQEAGIVSEGEIIGSLSPAIFDIYCFELCMVIALGCTMIIAPEKSAAFPAQLLQLLQSEGVTFIFWVPTIMVNIANLDLLANFALPELRMIWFAGEVFPTAKFNYWRGHLPHACFVNLYGPIEITLDCLYYIADRELTNDEPIPLGVPFINTDILLLTEDGKIAGKHEEGELCIRGSSLACGYYNDPQKTAHAFTQNPLNNAYPELIYHTGDLARRNDHGELIFLGRKDAMIKHFGYRLELGEIEHAAHAANLVENCCALYDAANKKIILVYQSSNEIPVSVFRAALAAQLPRYAIPSVFYKIDEMPRNGTGKIDRLLLGQTFIPRTNGV